MESRVSAAFNTVDIVKLDIRAPEREILAATRAMMQENGCGNGPRTDRSRPTTGAEEVGACPFGRAKRPT